MSNKIQELLAVLDLPKEEQAKWFKDNGYREYVCVNMKSYAQELKFNALFADLAFRLRDEAVIGWEQGGGRWSDGRRLVAEKLNRNYTTWSSWSKPIHWIIAALIAKELAK